MITEADIYIRAKSLVDHYGESALALAAQRLREAQKHARNDDVEFFGWPLVIGKIKELLA
jgi:hypothetical protein